MSQLITAMSLDLPDGTPVPLLVPRYRHLVGDPSGIMGIATRTVVVPNNGRQGSRSRTRFRDDRVITINGLTLGGGGRQPDRAWEEYWAISRAWSQAVDTPRRLAYTLGFGHELECMVRAEPLTAGVSVGSNMVQWQGTLRANDPRAYEPQWITSVAVPLAASTGGDIYPSTYPIHYKPPASTTVQIDNPGSVETPLIITMSGYLLNPIIRFGDRSMFFNTELAQGDSLVINTLDRTVLLNNESNRRSLLDTARSRWFDAPPGLTPLQLLAADSQPGAGLTVQYRIARQ